MTQGKKPRMPLRDKVAYAGLVFIVWVDLVILATTRLPDALYAIGGVTVLLGACLHVVLASLTPYKRKRQNHK